MKRMVICTFACHLMLASIASAQDNRFKAMWPFGKDKKATTNSGFNTINPFTSPSKPANDDKPFAFPSPTKLIDKAEETTDTMIKKSRDTWKGMQDFGKSLNPFVAKSKPKPKREPKRSMIDRLLPKKKKDSPTMGEFLTMKRPGF